MKTSTRLIVAAIALALLTPGLAAAHRIGPITEGFKGLPKFYCESTTDPTNGKANVNSPTTPPLSDWHDYAEVRTHDYGPPALGIFAFRAGAGPVFGSLADGSQLGVHGDTDCDGDSIPGDFDRHYEYASGGGVLLARNHSLVVSGVTGDGTETCFGLSANHEEAIEAGVNGFFDRPIHIYVNDFVWGAAIPFFVGADWAREGAAYDGCGDGVLEPCDPVDINEIPGVTCNPLDRSQFYPADFSGAKQENVGEVTFVSGANGAYSVFVGTTDVPATIGHVGTQPDPTKKKPSLPGGALLPNTLAAAFIQDRSNAPVKVIGIGPHCAGSRTGPWDPNPATPNPANGDNRATVTCAWDFLTSCAGTVAAVKATGPGSVSGNAHCNPGGAIAAIATASVDGDVQTRSGKALGTYKSWGCTATFDVVSVAGTLTATQGIVLCLVPLTA